MSFTDLDRGLSTPPLSPNQYDEGFGKYKPGPTMATTITTTTTNTTNSEASSRKQMYSPISPPVKLPSGLQVTRGNSRDSIGLNLQPQKIPNSHAHSPYPPPVSPKRKPNSPMAQHSRFLEDNTRFDTPRPTLTSSTAIAVNSVNTAENGTPRSPHTVFSSANLGNSHGNGNNRILGDYRPGDQDRRQVNSPPISPPQLSPSLSPLNGQHRGFIRTDNRGPHDSGVINTSSSDTVINIESDATRSPSGPVSSSSPSSLFASIQDQEHDYDLMVRHVSQQIFNISSNIAVLERLVPCLGQRRKDTSEMRASLHAVLDTTQDLVKSAHGLIKVLARYHQPPTSRPPPNIGLRVQTSLSPNEVSSRQRKILASRRQTHQRLTKDLSLASRAFQELQKQAVEAERKQVATLRRLSGSASLRRLSARRSDLMDLSQDEIEAGALSEARSGRETERSSSMVPYNVHDRELSVQEEALLREILAVDGELVFQESIIQERESEIRKIEEGMGQVLDVMRELGTLVHEQRGGVDFLHDNILQTRGRIQLAQQEITKASEYQRRSREKMCYVIMVLSIVVAVVMLAFIST
ncbi:Syntaxin-7 [Mortierella sp. AM989]|nr:Syntaxin-7 [Mortierella sp. AM989]